MTGRAQVTSCVHFNFLPSPATNKRTYVTAARAPDVQGHEHSLLYFTQPKQNENQEVKVYTWRVCLSLPVRVLFLKTLSSALKVMGDTARTKRREQLKRWAGSCTDKASAVPRRGWKGDAAMGATNSEAKLCDQPRDESESAGREQTSPLLKRR